MITPRNYIFFCFILSILNATWFDSIPRTLTQPNGQTIECFITGDQYGRRLHDDEDFTIILNPEDGYYYYAKISDDDLLTPSTLVVGDGDPSSAGLVPGYSISKEEYNRKKEFYNHDMLDQRDRDAPTSGEISQVNIFIRFADDPEFPQERAYYDALFQRDDDEPSLKHYFWDVSYNTLLVNTFHYPETSDGSNVSYVDQYNRSYYTPYSNANPDGYQNDNQRTQREHALLANAVNAITPIVGPGDPWIDVDSDDDGLVDAVSFVIYGSPGDWADLLWPHRWVLFEEEVYINGSMVYDYQFMLSEGWYFNVGVLCHEFGHVLGAPDYYHYDGGNAPTPVGSWDVMGSNGNPPQFPSAFTKWKYFDWLELEEITESGTYSLRPLQEQQNSIYKIASPNSDSEYFILEYRKQEGMYDTNAPGTRSGLVAYRINPNAGNGNAQGPPDELYVYRPGGDLSSNGNFNLAPYSAIYDHTELNDDTDPSSFLYNGGSGAEGGLNLFNVTQGGDSISFTVSFGVPIISVSPNALTFALESGENDIQSVIIENQGEPESVLNYQLVISNADSYLNPQGGPDDGGYYWTSSIDEPGLGYDWIDIEDVATQLNFPGNDDFATEQISLPFEFLFFGESFDYLRVNANGWVGWENENVNVWQNADIPSDLMPRPAIFGFFDDLNPNNDNGNASSSGNIYYHVNEERVVVWFDDVVRWEGDAGSGLYNFQIVLYANGNVKCNYREMSGALNQATIGWQNRAGSEGTQLSVIGQDFVGNEFTWEAKTYSLGLVSWLTASTVDGTMQGALPGGQSEIVYVQSSAVGLDEGDYSASIIITDVDAEPVTVPVFLTVTGENSTPTLPYIDIESSDNGIVELPDDVDPIFSAVANRYTHIVAPNDDLIQILIQDDFTTGQILHVKNVLKSYLTSVPGSLWGQNKTAIANSIAVNNAILFLLNNEDEYENPDLWALFDLGVKGQDLLATEVFPEGVPIYMNSSQRDATYEEVLHYVHGYGIQFAFPSMQNAIEDAMNTAIENGYYEPLSDLPNEHYDEEYLAMGMESYLGLWAHDPNGDGYCGGHEYAFINRDLMSEGDPDLFSIIEGFFGQRLLYTPHLSEDFSGAFYLKLQEGLDYTFRSQYLENIILSGENEVSIYGNERINEFIGNAGNNIFQGFEGDDIIFGQDGNDRAIFRGDRDDYVIIPPGFTDDSSYLIMDIMFPERDGYDHLFEIEEVEFNGILFQLSELLQINDNQVPKEYMLLPPYPNPFNPKTRISYSVAEYGPISINVFDMNGRLISNLIDADMDAGYYHIDWDGKNNLGGTVSSGVYIIQFSGGSYKASKKVLLIK